MMKKEDRMTSGESPFPPEVIRKIAHKIVREEIKNEVLISMDETDAPYEEGESPYPRTLEDDLFLLKMVKENNWELKPDSYLAKIEKEVVKNKENIHG